MYVGHAGGLFYFYWKSVVSRHENGPGRIYTAVCSSKAAKTTTGEVIKQAAGKGCEGGKLWCKNLEKYATREDKLLVS